MFHNSTYEKRLAAWAEFRQELETDKDPLGSVLKKYKSAPFVRIACDPYDKKTWPNPWELINENEYDEMLRLVGICYTLQLTDRFSQNNFEIHITQDRDNSEIFYLLKMDNLVFNINEEEVVHQDELPETVVSKVVFEMPPLQ